MNLERPVPLDQLGRILADVPGNDAGKGAPEVGSKLMALHVFINRELSHRRMVGNERPLELIGDLQPPVEIEGIAMLLAERDHVLQLPVELNPDLLVLATAVLLGYAFLLRASLTLRNRLVMAPMTRNKSPGNIPGPDVVDYYRRRAAGGIGLIITEGTSPSPNGLGYPRIPGIFSPEQVAGWMADLLGWEPATRTEELVRFRRSAPPTTDAESQTT